MRQLGLLLALAGAIYAEEKDLEQPPTSFKAKKLREEAQELWKGVEPLWEKVHNKQEVAPAEAALALPALEEAIELFEKSLDEEWNGDTNKTLANAARTWCRLYPLVPPPEPPTDEAEKKKAERAAKAEALARTREIREFVMKWGRERRADSLFRTCPKCDGRKEMRSPFGERSPCNACGKKGRLVEREAVIAARWNRYSPVYRSVGRHEAEVNRLLRSLAPDEQRDPFAPYIVSVLIKDVEDNDTWARVKVMETVQPSAVSNKTEKAENTYVLFRVGKVWYVYDQEADSKLLDLKDKLEPPK